MNKNIVKIIAFFYQFYDLNECNKCEMMSSPHYKLDDDDEIRHVSMQRGIISRGLFVTIAV